MHARICLLVARHILAVAVLGRWVRLFLHIQREPIASHSTCAAIN